MIVPLRHERHNVIRGAARAMEDPFMLVIIRVAIVDVKGRLIHASGVLPLLLPCLLPAASAEPSLLGEAGTYADRANNS